MKISEYLQKKIIPSGFLANFIITAVGVIIFNFIIDNKRISGTPALIIIGLAYMITGVGAFGLLRWILINGFRLIVYLVRLILWGNVEVTIAKEKVSFKTHFNK